MAASAISVWTCVWMGGCNKCCKALWAVCRLEKGYINASPLPQVISQPAIRFMLWVCDCCISVYSVCWFAPGSQITCCTLVRHGTHQGGVCVCVCVCVCVFMCLNSGHLFTELSTHLRLWFSLFFSPSPLWSKLFPPAPVSSQPYRISLPTV